LKDDAARLRIGGFVPLSTTDFPGKLAAVVFCQGCPWRCPYCHNPHLLPRRATRAIDWDSILDFLRRRRGLLDAVVFSGGEPTLQTGLAAAMCEVKSMGFEIGLHTAGVDSQQLCAVLPLVDWVGLDIKAKTDDYPGVTGAPFSGQRAWHSLAALQRSGVAYEVRTTLHPHLLPAAALMDLVKDLAGCGVTHYVVQEYRSTIDFAHALPETASYLTPSFCATLVRELPALTVRRA